MSPSLKAFIDGPARSFIVSQFFALWSIIVTVATVGWGLGPANGGYNDWPTFVTFMSHAWFGVFIGLVFGVGPYYRAKQGASRLANTVQLGNGITAVVSPSAKPPPDPPAPPAKE